MAKIWAEILDLERVGRGDNFFALGGHSLLALRAVTEIRQALGLELALSTIFETPTIEAIVAHARCNSSTREGPVGTKAHTISHQKLRNLVLLDACSDPSTSVTHPSTVVCIHAIDGGIGSYRPLVQHLRRHVHVYGLSAIDLIGNWLPPTGIDQIARTYISQIVKAQLSQNPILVGWSSGGWIALQMACEMTRQGRPPGGLVILDTAPLMLGQEDELPPTAPRGPMPRAAQQAISNWWRFVAIHTAPEGDDLIPERFWSLPHSNKCQFLLLHCRNTTIFNEDNAFLAAKSVHDIDYLFQLSRKLFSAFRDFKPPTYDGPVTLVPALPASLNKIDRAERQETTARHWRDMTTGPLKIVEVEGGHSAPVTGAGALIVANHIAEICNRYLL